MSDTGEGVTMVAQRLPGGLGREPCGSVSAFRMLGERLDVKRCNGAAFGIGASRYVAPPVMVYDLGKTAGKDAPPLDGAVGLDLLDVRRVTIRLRRHR